MVKLFVSLVVLATLLGQHTDGLSRLAPECSGTDMDLWRDGCNWCQCVNGQPSCEKYKCSRAELDTARCFGDCIGNARWKKDCNRCFCRGGKAGCTKRFCPPTGRVCSEQDRAKCPEYRMIEYMQVKGCRPVYPRRGRRCCATHFSCQRNFPKPSSEQCLYQGKIVPKGERLSKSVGCRFGCFCSGPRFVCAIPGCAFIRLEEGCYRTHKLNGCCPSGSKCESDNPAKCSWNGKTYFEGQLMNFKQQENSCQKCICSKDFRNPFAGPQCEKINCAFDLGSAQEKILKGCVPIFRGTRCCPFEFLCPGDEKTDTRQDDAVENPRGRVCKFDGLNIPIGKELKVTDRDVTCRCTAPPDVLCVRNV